MTENAAAPHAVVTCGGTHVLAVGARLTFGRGQENDLRIGHDPEDLRISRRAGQLECRSDGVLVHNVSRKRALRVQTFPGPDRTIEPLEVAGWPYTRFVVHVDGVPVPRIEVVTVGLGGTEPPPGDGRDSTTGFDRIESLTRRQRSLLAALCLPAMTGTGDGAETPTYARVQAILAEHGHHLSGFTVRNGFTGLRTLLTEQYGIEGLQGDGGNFLGPLASWARRSGNVVDSDLDDLYRDPGEDR